MIFKQFQSPQNKFTFENSDFLESIYSFHDLKEIFFEGEKINPFLYLKEWIDKDFFPDIIAAIIQNYFKHNYANETNVKAAIALCASILTDKSKYCKFLGFVTKNKDEGIKPYKEISFYKSFEYNKDLRSFIYGEKKENIKELFELDDFENSFSYFFIPGCQSIETLDPRIRKGAIVLTELERTKVLNNNFKFILSGWNNAKKEEQKVKFRNESLLMVNLLIHKLMYYNKNSGKLNFGYNDFIITENNSSNSTENITELFKIIETDFQNIDFSIKQINILIISSTFHLVQLQNKVFQKLIEIETKLNCQVNIYYIGSENPNSILKSSDHRYIKYLYKEIFSHYLKFPK